LAGCGTSCAVCTLRTVVLSPVLVTVVVVVVVVVVVIVLIGPGSDQCVVGARSRVALSSKCTPCTRCKDDAGTSRCTWLDAGGLAVLVQCDPTLRGSGRRRSDLGDIPKAAVGGLGFRKGENVRSPVAPCRNVLLGGGVSTCLREF